MSEKEYPRHEDLRTQHGRRNCQEAARRCLDCWQRMGQQGAEECEDNECRDYLSKEFCPPSWRRYFEEQFQQRMMIERTLKARKALGAETKMELHKAMLRTLHQDKKRQDHLNSGTESDSSRSSKQETSTES
ncbi:MAG: hypothetical protein MHM6MM_007456 [Cercozoa sp. M6MM]